MRVELAAVLLVPNLRGWQRGGTGPVRHVTSEAGRLGGRASKERSSERRRQRRHLRGQAGRLLPGWLVLNAADGCPGAFPQAGTQPAQGGLSLATLEARAASRRRRLRSPSLPLTQAVLARLTVFPCISTKWQAVSSAMRGGGRRAAEQTGRQTSRGTRWRARRTFMVCLDNGRAHQKRATGTRVRRGVAARPAASVIVPETIPEGLQRCANALPERWGGRDDGVSAETDDLERRRLAGRKPVHGDGWRCFSFLAPARASPLAPIGPWRSTRGEWCDHLGGDGAELAKQRVGHAGGGEERHHPRCVATRCRADSGTPPPPAAPPPPRRRPLPAPAATTPASWRCAQLARATSCSRRARRRCRRRWHDAQSTMRGLMSRGLRWGVAAPSPAELSFWRLPV